MAKSIHDPIFSAVGGFFTSNDNYRHAIVGTTEGKVFEIFFTAVFAQGQAYLACFDAIVAADAFATPDDNFNHVVVATSDGNISEIFYNQTGTFFTTPPLANFSGILAVSGFFSTDDNFRHAVVATNDGNITEVFYHPTAGVHISEPPLANFQGVVSIAAFYAEDDHMRIVIVATSDGAIHEVFYRPDIGAHITQPALAKFTGIVDIAAFYTGDDRFRHVIVATKDGKITEVFYHPSIGVHISQPALANFENIAGIAGFYTGDDRFRHVIVATNDGAVTEVSYSPQAGSHVSQPPLGVFAVNPPTLEDISPDVSNLDANASAQLAANNISTAGRSVSIAGNADELFVFNEKAGVWKNSGGTDWSQLPQSPPIASLFPPSAITVDPNDGGHLVAGTENGAHETDDGGLTWQPIPQTWPCGSTAIRAVAFANNSALLLATDCGVATRPAAGQPFTFFSTAGQQVGALAVSETRLWAITPGSLYMSADNGTTWKQLLANNPTLATFDSTSLAAFDGFAYVQTSLAGLGGCGHGNVIGIYDVSTGTLTQQPVRASGSQTCDGTGLGGRRFIKSFVRKDPTLPAIVGPGGRLQLFFGAGQELYQALGMDNGGNVTNWSLVVATHGSGAKTSSSADPPVHIHADIWDFLIDTSADGTKAWVAGDGGVYENTLATPFTFPESEGWIRRFGGMHTHQAHMVTVIPTNPVNRSRLAYPSSDNDGWYRNASLLSASAPPWEVTNLTNQRGSLGDANWSVADASSTRFILIVRHQESAAFINYNRSPDISFIKFLNFWMKKDSNGKPKPMAGHFFPSGPTAFQFIQSPKSDGRFPGLDAVMMCDLPLIRYDEATDTNVPMLPNTPLGQNTNGQPVLLRNSSFDANPDINASNAAGWTIEIPSFPPNTQGFYVTGSRAAPVYYSFTSSTLSRLDGTNWTTVATGLTASLAVGPVSFGPAFVNPYDSNTLYVITPQSIKASVDGGKSFNAEAQLTALVAGSQNLPTPTLAQIGFNYDNPAEMVAGAASGVFYRNGSGQWVDLTWLLPRPLSLITGVGIDCEAIYVSFDSRSIARITSYRNARVRPTSLPWLSLLTATSRPTSLPWLSLLT
jgi:hypothetical protein